MKEYQVVIKDVAPLLQNKIEEMETGEKKRGEGRDNPERCKEKLYMVGKVICQPAICVESAMIKTSADLKFKGRKSYKDLFKGNVFVKPDMIKHKIQKWEVHQSTVVIPSTKGRVNRYRPIFKNWELEFVIMVLDDRIETDVLKLALDEAGRTTGIGDWRPRYGRFVVTKFQEVVV